MASEEVKIERIEDPSLEELLPHWMEVFDQPGDVFTGVWAACPPERRFTFAARGADGIAATVQLYVLPLRDERGEPQPVGCVANVSTKPEYRGRGLARRLIEASIETMEEAGCGWSYLFTGVPDFYAKLGWRGHDRKAYVFEPAAVPRPENPQARLLTGADLPELRRLYERYHAATPVSLDRNEIDWAVKIPARFSWRPSWGIGDPLRAYAIGTIFGDELVIGEWGAETTEEYAALLAAFAEFKPEGKLVVSAADTPESLAALAGAVEVPQSVGMARPISSDWTHDRLAALLTAPGAKLSNLDNF